MLNPMRLPRFIITIAFLSGAALAVSQSQPTFEVASVRPSTQTVGPDYNNQISWTATGFTARNATLKRLVADAWSLQLNQVFGPTWLDRAEYDIAARAPESASNQQRALMLQTLLVERFALKKHSETRTMRAYELTTAKSGPRIKPAASGESAESQPGAGFHFHGDMRQFADLLAVQLSIPAAVNPNVPAQASASPTPVLDRTGLEGIYDFSVDIHPELGTDGFAAWKRALSEQLGLALESRKGDVRVIVVDDAAKVPSEN